MSTALKNAAHLKPDIRLADAISQFQADLSSREKEIFTECRDKSVHSTPTIWDVSRVTAEIDRHPSWQGRASGRRCFGPRLIKLLEAVQQFASIGDVVVGGSQNIIACGVWSLVRLTLLSVVTASSNLEKLTGFFMMVGGSAPRYQNMALLYPQSAALQAHLCEYFIVVVRICHKLIKALKALVWRQIGGSFLSTSEMSGFQSDLDRWATSIKDEVTILTAQSINEQAADLRLVSQNWAEGKRRRELKDYHRLLDLCSTYGYQTSWKEYRKIGNTDLFNSLETYRDWKAASRPLSSTLVCMGKLGSGKSVWLANMVDDLHLTLRGDKQSLGYFFCRYNISESLNAKTIIGSITRQLLQQHAQGAQFHASREDTFVLDLKDLVDLLKAVVRPNHDIHLVIDGLDECNDTEREKVLQALVQLQTVRRTHVCLSFRLEADNSMRLSIESIPNCSTASIPEDNPDIGYFVDAELQRCLETQKLALGDPTLIVRIRDSLLQGAQGMFLWVSLQITSLCASRTDNEIQEALENLPRSLPETFSRILERSRESEDGDFQRQILGFVIAARRPLTTGELREALAVVPGDINWNPGRLMNNIYAALSCCGCLITVDEEELTIGLVHHSAKTYLTSGSMPPIPSQVARSAMAHAVVTYLNYDVFDKQVSTAVTPRVSGRQVMSNVASSFDSGVRRMALSILKSGRESDIDVGSLLRETVMKCKGDAAQAYEFHGYAKSYLAEHLVDVSPLHERAVLLLSKLMTKTENRLAAGHLIRSESHAELFHALIVRGLDVEVEHEVNGATPLIWAASRGHVPLVAELLKRRANLEAFVKIRRANGFYPPHDRRIPKLNKGATPLLEAAASGHEVTVKALIENGAKIKVKDSQGYSPLTRAIQAGAKFSIKLLLHHGPDQARHDWGAADYATGGQPGYECLGADEDPSPDSFPLQTAIRVGDEEAVSRLIEKGFRLRGWRHYGIESPLSIAVFKADLSMMKLLIKSGADLSEPDSVRFPWSAPEQEQIAVLKLLAGNGAKVAGSSSIIGKDCLHRAAGAGGVGVVNMLLDNGAYIEYSAKYTGTPLAEAASMGREATVRLLLDRGADVEATSPPEGDTPLLAAIESNEDGTVKILCERGANLQAIDCSGFAPLILATYNRNERIVKVLLNNGADRETKSPDGRTALLAATDIHEERLVKLLLDRGADTEARTDEGLTSLHRAINARNENAIKPLIKRNANMDAGDKGNPTRLRVPFNRRNAQIVETLLIGGADTESRNREGLTPLYEAASNGHVEIVKLLIEYGARLNSRSGRMTSLMIAADKGHVAVVEELLQARANANMREWGYPSRKANEFANDREVKEVFRRHGL